MLLFRVFQVHNKGLFDDWTDIMISIVVVVVALFVFNTFATADEQNIKAKVTDKDDQFMRETLLLNYLRTPVRETDFAVNKDNLGLDTNVIALANFVMANNMDIGDVFSLMQTDPNYVELLYKITNQKEFNRDVITVIYPNGRNDIISAGGCILGKTSDAYVSTPDNQIVTIRMSLCP